MVSSRNNLNLVSRDGYKRYSDNPNTPVPY